MVIRSWHCRAHSLDEVSSAKGCQLGKKRSARLYLCSSCMSELIQKSSCSSCRRAHATHAGELMQLMQKSSSNSCRRSHAAHAEELMRLMQESSCRRAHAAHAGELM